MNAYQRMQHTNGIEAAEIAVDISKGFAAEMLAKMTSHPTITPDADYLAGYQSVVNG